MNKAVIGLGFGDEGKGITTDYLVSKYELGAVVRYSGGQQAGHTVVVDDKRHVFSNFGSGTLRDAITKWSRYCTVDPIGIVNEFNALKKLGYDPILQIDPRCPVTTPYDVMANQKYSAGHGTVGVGVGQTWQREHDHVSLLFMDLMHPEILPLKINTIRNYYSWLPEYVIDRFLECSKELTEIADVLYGIADSDVVFEGSQGLLLDQSHGFFPHVTRSNTGVTNILELSKKHMTRRFYRLDLYYVTRAYSTRHGNGPMPGEDVPFDIEDDPRETNVSHKFQGEFRRGILDLDALKYALDRDRYQRHEMSAIHFSENLVITCLDHMKEWKYVKNGGIVAHRNLDDFIVGVSDHLDIKNVIISEDPDSSKMTQVIV